MKHDSFKPAPPFTGPSAPPDFYRRRLRNFGATMAATGAGFILYYLGLFGTVPGPLAPEKIGLALAGAGVTRLHVGLLFLALFSIALSWNWIYNFCGPRLGIGLRCAQDGCAAAVKRKRRIDPRTGRWEVAYDCPHGHRHASAQFSRIEKGAVSHTLWAASLGCSLILVWT